MPTHAIMSLTGVKLSLLLGELGCLMYGRECKPVLCSIGCNRWPLQVCFDSVQTKLWVLWVLSGVVSTEHSCGPLQACSRHSDGQPTCPWL